MATVFLNVVAIPVMTQTANLRRSSRSAYYCNVQYTALLVEIAFRLFYIKILREMFEIYRRVNN
jgi:hypothetical protein